MERRISQFLTIISLFLAFTGCREPFEIESIDFQNSLVVEATLTNELKQHTLKLSRTYELNQEGPAFENNAVVLIEDSDGNMFSFVSVGEGVYQSEIEFQAIPNVSYQLLITTAQGERYQSSSKVLTPISEITSLYGELITNNSGDEGVQFFVDSDNQDGDAGYFRYEYEETYKVVAPNYFPFKAIITDYFEVLNYLPGPRPNLEAYYNVTYAPRSQEEGTCYSSNKQQGIILTTTNGLLDNEVFRFPIRFINKEDGILRDRYSILVKQYVQSIESYSYYKALDDLGDTESILSQSQPGFVFGNITSVDNPNQTVIGYFDVSSVSERRIFIDYSDFNIPQPNYLYECDIRVLEYNDNNVNDGDSNERIEIYKLLTSFEEQNLNYDIVNLPTPNTNGTWTIVNPECGDCTSVSSNIRPAFWED
jgi:hypothetical protein